MKKIFWVILIVALVFSAISGCSENNSKNNYEKAERALIKNAYSSGARLFQNNGTDDEHSGAVTLTITPEQYIADLLGMGSLNPTVIEFGAETDGERILGSIIYKNGLRKLMSLDFLTVGSMISMYIPQLLDMSISWNPAIDPNKSNFKMPELPSEEVVKIVADAVLNEYFALVSDAHVEKNIDVLIDGVTVAADKNTIDITDEIVYKLCLAALRAIDNNDELKEYINKIVGMVDLSDWNLQTALEGAIMLTEKTLADTAIPKSFMTMDVYIKNGEIVKRVIEVKEGGYSLRLTMMGGDINFEVNVLGQKMAAKFSYDENNCEGELTFSGIKVATITLGRNDYKGKDIPEKCVIVSDITNIEALIEELGIAEAFEAFIADLTDDEGRVDIIGAIISMNTQYGGLTGTAVEVYDNEQYYE